MKKTISIITEEFENEQTGEVMEGITIIIDGVLKNVFDVLRDNNPKYINNVTIVHDAFIKGLEALKDELQ